MLLDRFNRKIDYLRISVTDRCNRRCIYCMPNEPFVHKNHADILSYEQIEAVAKTAAKLGITKIRLTGGEPLVRKDIERLVARLAAIEGIIELCMTTNGSLLAEKAALLKQAGLTRLNISMDSVEPERYTQLTGGDLQQAIKAIEVVIKAGFENTKINMVILDNTTEKEIEAMQAFCRETGLHLQKIMRFSLYDRDDLSRRFQTERPPKCQVCNRLRLTADGFLKPCLFSDDEIRLNFDDIEGSIRKAVFGKAKSGTACKNRFMNQIGG